MRFFPRHTPVRPLADEFAEDVRARSRGTKKSWKTDAGRLREAVKLLDVRYAEQVCPSAVARAMSAKEAQGRSPKTVNSYREIISRFCGFLLLEKEIVFRETDKTNPASLVAKRRERAPQIRYLKPEQYRAFLEGVFPRPQLKAMVATMIFAGLRRGELLWLTKDDIDLERRLIHVRAKTVDGESWQPKTGDDRSVPVSQQLLEELSRWRSPSGTPWHFPSPRGARWNEDNFSKSFRRAQKSLGDRWTCLDLRHTFGTMLARNNVSLFKISKLMGNSPQICRKHYASLRPEDLTEEVEFSPAERGPERACPAPESGKDVSPSVAFGLHEFMRRSLKGAKLPPPPARQDEE